MKAMTVLPADYEDAGLGVVKVKVSRNGQISVPAAVRHRWQASEVLIQDQGDRLIVRPVLPWEEIVGSYAGRGPTSDEMRAEDRAADAEREDRSEGRRP